MSRPRIGRGCFRAVAIEIVFGDGTAASQQRQIDLARVALGMKPGTNSLDGYTLPRDRRARSKK